MLELAEEGLGERAREGWAKKRAVEQAIADAEAPLRTALLQAAVTVHDSRTNREFVQNAADDPIIRLTALRLLAEAAGHPEPLHVGERALDCFFSLLPEEKADDLNLLRQAFRTAAHYRRRLELEGSAS